jgi:hypothetical protein
MALTGSMRDFGISEILQLIGHQKKSGMLLVTDKNHKVEILFDQGNIVAAKHQPPRDDFDLGTALVRAGLVPRPQMQAAKKEQTETLKPLEQILINAGAVEHNDLTAMAKLMHLEIIYSLFLWKDGDYSFDQGPVSYPQQWTDPISSEHVLMDGYRIKDEWPLIEKAIPNTSAVPEKVAGEFGAGDRLNEEQRKVFDLIDGKRTAQDIVFLSRMGKFDTFKLLKELIENGRVRIAGTVAGPARRDSNAVMFRAAVGAVLALGVIALLTGLWRNLDRMLFPDLSSPGLRAREALWAWYKVDRLSNALTMFAAMKGGYPESLNRLVQDGEVSGSALETGFGKVEYSVAEGGRSCTVTVPGFQSAKVGKAGDDDEGG